jgi:hypothetical protein
MSKFDIDDLVIWKRNPGSPLMKDAVNHIGQTAKVVGIWDMGNKPITAYRIRFKDGYTINAFDGELTLESVGKNPIKPDPKNPKKPYVTK